VNFAVFSENATKMELCLFDESGKESASARESAPRSFHGYALGMKPASATASRARRIDRIEASASTRTSSSSIRYARANRRQGRLHAARLRIRGLACAGVAGRRIRRSISPPISATTRAACRSRSSSTIASTGKRQPRVPWTDTVLYEAHVKGMTKRHPRSPRRSRHVSRLVAQPIIVISAASA